MIYDPRPGKGDAQDLHGFENVVRQTTKGLREHVDEFDSIAVIGMSGVLVGAPVALRLRKPLVVIRKETDDSHAQRFHGEGRAHINIDNAGSRAVFLDDFIVSGNSRRRVKDALATHGAELVAQYTYRSYRISADEGWRSLS